MLFVLAGCATGGRFVPVFGTGESASGGVYVVKRGDTLYSIAFRYGLDFKALARANRIAPPYTIFVDQRIVLREVGPSIASTRDGPPPASSTRTAPPRRPATTNPPATASPPAPAVADDSIRWTWPYQGEVVGRFSLSGTVNKGIDIRGNVGDPVRATADGVVVYAGGGLRGYGKLVIVKHNDRYLSAYGHNQSILVKEGDRVKSGQAVARIGGPNGDRNIMHFEIRRDGKPRDPLNYLPSPS